MTSSIAAAAILWPLYSFLLTNAMDLTLLDHNTGSLCLDGSPSGYYYSQGSYAGNLWVIYLQGGGACFSQETCSARAKTALGSSVSWAKTTNGPPVCSDDSESNPDFYQAQKVYIPYCSGDTHVGQRTNASDDTWGFYFSGHLNLESIIKHLKATTNFADASDVLLTGSSAGGIGTFGNVDWLAEQLPSARVWGAPQAGWFFPGDADDQPNDPLAPPSDWPHWITGAVGGEGHSPGVYNLWQGYLNPDCAARYGATGAWQCGSVHVSYPFIKSTLFVMENKYDTNQLYAQLLMPNVYNSSTDAYVTYFGYSMGNSTNQVFENSAKPGDAIFFPSCFDHGSGLGVDGGTKINNMTSQDILGDWFFKRGKLSHRVKDDCAGLACNPTCDDFPPQKDHCESTLKSLCPLTPKSDCLHCAEAHRTELKKAGCTVEEVVKKCSSS